MAPINEREDNVGAYHRLECTVMHLLAHILLFAFDTDGGGLCHEELECGLQPAQCSPRGMPNNGPKCGG